MSDKTQRLVLSILDFLTTSINDGTVKADDQEGVEVAVQCIGEAFGVDPTDDAQRERLSIKPANLQSIFDVYLKTRDKAAGTSATTAPAMSSAASAGPSAADKAAAEKCKQAGNAQMSSRSYQAAIDSYTAAIGLDPSNPVYYSNRAAAYSSLDDHDNAIADANKALEVDPSFVKAYSRLGHAHYSKGDYPSAVEAFQSGLALDPSNANLSTGLNNAQARVTSSPPPATAPAPNADVPDFASMANAFRGAGGAGAGGAGAGGMPDLGGLLNNPAMMQMAQQMMANGGLQQMMQNPAMRNMMERMQSGGGMPSMAELMSDPSIASLASNFMGGAGRGAGGAPPPGSV